MIEAFFIWLLGPTLALVALVAAFLVLAIAFVFVFVFVSTYVETHNRFPWSKQ